MRLTILNVAYPLAPVGPGSVGGAEQVLAHLDTWLTRAGHHSVVIACEGSQTAGTLMAVPKPAGQFDEAARRAAAARFRQAIRQALQLWPADVVHLHGFDFHECLPPPGVPVLATLHLPAAWYPPEIFRLRRPATYLNCVSASQHRTCPPCASLLPPIENGVPEDLASTRYEKRGFALALGRICPEKGFHIALDAAARASVPVLLAGEVFPYETHERYFESEIKPRLNQTARFIGPVGLRRKRRLLSSARCLLVPSLAPETSSLVTMEALACGTPVIAFKSGALVDLVEHGRTGFLVDSVREMAEAIHETHSIDPAYCRQQARHQFSSQRMAEKYLALYLRLARIHSRPCLAAVA